MQIGCLRCAPAARKLQDAASGPTDIYWTARLCSHLAYSGYRHQAGRGFVFNSARYKLQVKGGLRQGRSCKDAHAPDIIDITSHGQGNIKALVGPPSGMGRSRAGFLLPRQHQAPGAVLVSQDERLFKALGARRSGPTTCDMPLPSHTCETVGMCYLCSLSGSY